MIRPVASPLPRARSSRAGRSPGAAPRSRRGPARALVALCTTGLLGAALPLPAGAAEPAVTLVGSLQSELGCPGDWQPECTATVLAPVAGSPGTHRATFDVPAGRYEFKVTVGGSWSEDYGAGGAPGGANLTLTAPGGPVTFTYDATTHVISDDVPDTGQAAGHWLSADLLAWNSGASAAGTTFRLYSAPDGGLAVADGAVTGGTWVPLERSGDALPADLAREFPHLADLDALRLPRGAAARARELLEGQLLLAAVGADGRVAATTGVQVPGVLDDLYAGAVRRELGPTWRGGRPSLALWAPTARSVVLRVTPPGSGAVAVPMRPDRDGVWTATGERRWRGASYTYEVEVFVPETGRVERNVVTDPYSTGLTANSERSLLLDLDDPALEPAGWDRLAQPAPLAPERLSLYELHVRDFSISDATVPAEHRGTYEAFTHAGSDGMRHLRELAGAGMNAVHLLPVNDLSSIEERRSAQDRPDCDLASLPPDGEEQQECVSAVAATDGFNWGYDPLHWTTPEGSYATDPDGGTRTREFRDMVASLKGAGLRVVQDVVYNHTPDAGQAGRNDLDRIVPGYYHRLDAETGAVATSTCCPGTAPENAMMGKLVVDSVVTLARAYKLDGFRFDLMGHHPKENVVAVRRALDALTPQRDGVDGKRIVLYGEGWEFGEVADDARFVQATQANMAGTGIATFSDRLRDAVRGGGPFDEDPRVQGFGSGLLTDPNGAAVNGTPEEQRRRLLHAQDLVKLGLAGNLRDYRFTDSTGRVVRGSEVDYNGQPAGYAADPQEVVTYVEAHDNETLYDALAYKLPQDTPMADRIRMQTLSLATTALGQGISFWHAGGDQLRSKSLDRNSYDSGDWFNVLDHSLTTNGFGRGLPPAADNEAKRDFQRPLLADPALRPSPADLRTARDRAADLLRLRTSTPLLSLGSAELVQQKVSFPLGGPQQTPGVVVMRIDDTAGRDVDPALRGLVVVLNASDEATTQRVECTAGQRWALHPVQAGGTDPVVRTAGHDAASGSFTVPARTAAVFVLR